MSRPAAFIVTSFGVSTLQQATLAPVARSDRAQRMFPLGERNTLGFLGAACGFLTCCQGPATNCVPSQCQSTLMVSDRLEESIRLLDDLVAYARRKGAVLNFAGLSIMRAILH